MAKNVKYNKTKFNSIASKANSLKATLIFFRDQREKIDRDEIES